MTSPSHSSVRAPTRALRVLAHIDYLLYMAEAFKREFGWDGETFVDNTATQEGNA